MAHINDKARKRKNKARERIEKRKQRRETITSIANEGLEKLPDVKLSGSSKAISSIINFVSDAFWYFRKNAPIGLIAKILAGFILIFGGFFILSTLFSKNIGPNITSMGLKLSGQNIEEASETLFTYWHEGAQIDILVEGTVIAQVLPSNIGLALDATATAEAAKAAGLSGFIFGHEVEPVISADYGDVQTYLLGIANDIWIPSNEAGYEWRDGTLVSVQGNASRELDVDQSIQLIINNPLLVVTNGSVELITTSTEPTVLEADPYYEQAMAFVTSDFLIQGYDPFRDETKLFATTRQEMAGWLVATDTGLSIREDSMEDFVNVANSQLDVENWSRYLDPNEIYRAISDAFSNGDSVANVRIRYADSTYILENGDWGYRLSRRLGLPLFNINNANPGINWDEVFAGDRISVPSRDLVIPLDPIQSQRIVVDLDRRYLVAFENDEIIFDWPISVGQTTAPTIPGVYQILQKEDVAYGSTFSLCNDNAECGQWEMDHFMGIYEVSFGLTNGFHGTVRLPNGATLTQGSSQLASTFGCVMSDSDQAALLYDWAETGTVVELIASDFPPESELGRRAMAYIAEQS